MPRWLDRLTGRPSLEDLVERVTSGLEGLGFGPITAGADSMTLLGGPRQAMQFSLEHVYAEYQRVPSHLRALVVARYLNVASSSFDSMPMLYESVRHRLMPVLLQGLQRSGPDAGRQREPGPQLARMPYNTQIDIGLVVDAEQAMTHVNASHLDAWRVSFDKALEAALDNLRERSPTSAHQWEWVAPGVKKGLWLDSYESARLLLPDVVHRSEIASPVVMVPTRDVILVASAHSDAALSNMAALASRALLEQTRWISGLPYEFFEGRWSVFAPPAECAGGFGGLADVDRYQAYAAQKVWLDEAHRGDGTQVYVAKLMVFSDRTGALATTTCWTEGLETLLPRAASVSIGPAGDPAFTDAFQVPWSTFVEAFSDILEAQQMVPERWRLRVPTHADWPAESARRLHALRAAHGKPATVSR